MSLTQNYCVQQACSDVLGYALLFPNFLSSSEEGDIQVFAVSATDGLLDYVSIDDIAKHVALGLYDDEEGPHLLSACEALISAAAGGWHRHRQGRYRDDIAISVSRLTW